MAYLLKDLTRQEKNARLAAAYHRMNHEGRDVLFHIAQMLSCLPHSAAKPSSQKVEAHTIHNENSGSGSKYI
jgi:hypothetical protein